MVVWVKGWGDGRWVWSRDWGGGGRGVVKVKG